jgi:hypothetical protein
MHTCLLSKVVGGSNPSCPANFGKQKEKHMRTEIKDAGGRTTGWIEEDGRVKDANGRVVAKYNNDTDCTHTAGGKFIGHGDQSLIELGKRKS